MEPYRTPWTPPPPPPFDWIRFWWRHAGVYLVALFVVWILPTETLQQIPWYQESPLSRIGLAICAVEGFKIWLRYKKR